MIETVEVRSASGLDPNGDPIALGAAITVVPLEIAPGNTARVLNDEGALDSADFTLYFALRVNVGGTWQLTDTVVRDDYIVTVRDRTCQARVQRFESGGRGGVVVLCKSATGVS